MRVLLNDLSRIHNPLRGEFHKVLDHVLDTSAYVNDTTFAEAFATYTGSKHCVSCASGTDALYIAIKALELPQVHASRFRRYLMQLQRWQL